MFIGDSDDYCVRLKKIDWICQKNHFTCFSYMKIQRET
jgi:hypothetical protein